MAKNHSDIHLLVLDYRVTDNKNPNDTAHRTKPCQSKVTELRQTISVSIGRINPTSKLPNIILRCLFSRRLFAYRTFLSKIIKPRNKKPENTAANKNQRGPLYQPKCLRP